MNSTVDIELAGQIDRITYFNAESGFTIAKVSVDSRLEPITVVGSMMAPVVGQLIHMRGRWEHHPKFGRQFKIDHCQAKVPTTAHAIQKYLGSGLIKGLGPVTAERIVKRFQDETLAVLENDIDRLREVEGIGPKRIRQINAAWKAHSNIRDLIILLQHHDIGTGYAAKIVKRYGHHAVDIVTRNPYRLATDIIGIGFKKADQMAEKLNIPKNSPLRSQAGLLHLLHQFSDEGHVYYPYDRLLTEAERLLQIDREVLLEAVAALATEGLIRIEDLNDAVSQYQPNHKAVYLAAMWACESGVARRLDRLIRTPKKIDVPRIEQAMRWVQRGMAITLAEKQVEALRLAFEHKALVITGGPGTGKTTVIRAILKVFMQLTPKILLAAPTGRAAKRMSDTTGMPAQTIHRLLEYNSATHRFVRDGQHPLLCDLLVIDEASMIDTVLMHHLLKAVPQPSTFILVGDVNQLPSVGAGNVLRDIIASERIPVVVLNQIFRQAKRSHIVVNAHRINQGIVPPTTPPQPPASPDSDYYFIEQADPNKVLELILTLVQQRIPRRFGFDPITDIQVMSPMHRGLLGTANLNRELQSRLNSGALDLIRGDQALRVNDKVMQIRNNYDKSVFNGDIGRIAAIDHGPQTVQIDFEGRRLTYAYSDLDEIVLAYAISVHKSQGSEYPVVVIPVITQHYMLLQRNLIYTAVTRGKQLVVMVGSHKAMAIGIRNDKPQHRYTRLSARLM